MKPEPSIANPQDRIDGKTISQWTEEWMKWAFHAPAETPPATPFGSLLPDYPSASPAYAGVDNHGPVFFLYGGNWGTGSDPSQLPTINVPGHKSILVPLINSFDIESGDPLLATIPSYVSDHRGTYADEARYVTSLADQKITDAFITITKAGQTQPLLDLHWPNSNAYREDTGIFALGNPDAKPLDYLGEVIKAIGADFNQHNVPFTEEVGRWAMITGLSGGDYIFHFGGSMDPVFDTGPGGSGMQILSGASFDTTEKLHING